MHPTDLITYQVFGNSLITWSIGLGLFLFVWTTLGLVLRFLRKRLLAIAQHKDAIALAAHVVTRTRQWFLLLAALFVSSRVPELPATLDTWIGRAFMIGLLLQAGLWTTAALGRTIERRRAEEIRDNPGAVATMDLLSFLGRIGVWSIVLLLMLDNLGVNVTTLIAGLGVGGVAIALAAQNILGDLFASLSIVLDKPFVVGDFLIIGEFLGAVEKVGIKTTRVRSLSGEQLVFSNNDLLNSRIRNYGRMFERRVVFSIGVTYQTSADQLKRIPVILREAVEACKEVRFDRAHFQKYGDFALVFEIVYFVLSPDYNKYMDIQQTINLAIFEQFEGEGIEFAYPTQTVFMRQVENGGTTQHVE